MSKWQILCEFLRYGDSQSQISCKSSRNKAQNVINHANCPKKNTQMRDIMQIMTKKMSGTSRKCNSKSCSWGQKRWNHDQSVRDCIKRIYLWEIHHYLEEFLTPARIAHRITSSAYHKLLSVMALFLLILVFVPLLKILAVLE